MIDEIEKQQDVETVYCNQDRPEKEQPGNSMVSHN